MSRQKNSPLQYLIASTMQDRVRATVAQSQVSQPFFFVICTLNFYFKFKFKNFYFKYIYIIPKCLFIADYKIYHLYIFL